MYAVTHSYSSKPTQLLLPGFEDVIYEGDIVEIVDTRCPLYGLFGRVELVSLDLLYAIVDVENGSYAVFAADQLRLSSLDEYEMLVS